MAINTLCACYANLISQNVKDSTFIYYESITDIKDINLTARAFDFFEKKAEASLTLKDTLQAAYYWELISLGQFKMGLSYESESTAVKALSLLENIKNNPKTIEPRERLYNQLGILYRKIEDFDNSFKYYDKAISLNKHFKDKMAIISNIANNHADQNNYEKAVEVLSRYHQQILQLENSGIKATCLDNLGYYQSKTGDSRALPNMTLALDMRKNLGDLTGLFSSYRHLSVYYSNLGDLDKATNFAKKAETVSNTLNSPTYQLEAMKLILNLNRNPAFKKYTELNANIERANQLQQNKFAAIKYNIDESEQKLKTVALENERQKKLNLMYLSLVLFILLSSGFIYFVIKSKHKKEKIQQVYITEARISKKVHDEVANDLYHVMTSMQSSKATPEVVLDDLETIYNKTRDISRENSSIDVTENYSGQLKDLLLSYRTDTINIVAMNISKVNWDTVSQLKKSALYRVLQELMTNMRKHSRAQNVVLRFNQDRKTIQIDYKDDGVGCNLVKNNGLQNTENRMASINGKIIFETQPTKGFKANITI